METLKEIALAIKREDDRHSESMRKIQKDNRKERKTESELEILRHSEKIAEILNGK
jgi:hypothetical protein